MKLSATEALVTAVTTLGENHGDEIVPAIAIRLECTVLPRMLNQFSKDLLPALFGDEIPRIPELGALHWKAEYEKAHFFIDGLEFKGVDVKKIQFAAREGFLVDMGLTVKVSKPTGPQRGQLTGLIKKQVKVVLESMQLRIDEQEEEGDGEGNDSQPGLPGTEDSSKATKDGKPIKPLITEPAES